MWMHWIRHAWVTRKCPWDSNVQTSRLPRVDIEPAVQNVVVNPAKLPMFSPEKYPTQLTDEELYLVKMHDSYTATQLALDSLCKNQ